VVSRSNGLAALFLKQKGQPVAALFDLADAAISPL
jgi:hypothetical protein